MDQIDRVLLIEDEEIDQKQYARVIRSSGLVAELETFTYADDALDYLLQSGQPVDLIFLDINIPRMDGFQFLERLIAHTDGALGSCIVFMLTTSLNPADKERAMAFEVVKAFINKPLTQEDVQLAANLVRSARQA